MYAIIRAGGKQAKVHEGDVIDVERIKDGADKVTFTPLLLVKEDGSVVSDRKSLAKAAVTAEVVGEHRGPKVEVFKYKAKTGYRRRQGHRQTYTTLKVTSIAASTGRKKSSEAKKESSADTEAAAASKPKPAAKATASKAKTEAAPKAKPAAKSTASKSKPAAKSPASKPKPAAKSTAKSEPTDEAVEEE